MRLYQRGTILILVLMIGYKLILYVFTNVKMIALLNSGAFL